MRTYNFKEFISFVRTHSPFYRSLYQSLPNDCELTDLPLVDQSHFWQANSWKQNQVLTGSASDGIIFKSGGTTGVPKFSIYTRNEWDEFTSCFGQGMARIGLSPGDRVGNLFYAGELYASFVFIENCLHRCPIPVLHFPIAGQSDPQSIAKTIADYQIDVLVGVPTTLISLAPLLVQFGLADVIKKIYFGGESMFEGQKNVLRSFFPNVQIGSIGYASVDGGHLGFSDQHFQADQHGVFSPSTIVEILDIETNQPITKPGIVGKLIYTNLTRRLMPIVRYPVGDMATWIDEKCQIFQLKGRSEEGARIGPVTVGIDDVQAIIRELKLESTIANFQLIIKRQNNLDQLFIAILPTKESEKSAIDLKVFVDTFYQQRKMFFESVQKGLIAPVCVKLVDQQELLTNSRTGKLRRVIDQRF